MKKGVNKVILVGNLGSDPDARFMASGDPVTNLSIATSETWKDKQTGEKKESTEWHRVVCFKKLAEIASGYLKKGSKVYIEGKLQTRKWQDNNGQDRYTTEIVANELQMLDSRVTSEGSNIPKQSNKQPAQSDPESYNDNQDEGFDDDIPF